MAEPEEERAWVLVVLGPEAQGEVVDHTLRELNNYGIAFTKVDWRGAPAVFASGAHGIKVVIFETGVAYSSDHLRVPDDMTVPVIRVVTDSEPPPELILTDTAFMATAGYGVPGAVNAGLYAARILALSDPALRDRLMSKRNPGS